MSRSLASPRRAVDAKGARAVGANVQLPFGMIVFKWTERLLAPITDFQSRDAAAAEVATGSGKGEAHVHIVAIAAGGEIGPHVAGFGQLFICLEGTGWVAGANGERVSIARGEAAHFTRGELHSKGSTEGLQALIIQLFDLDLSPASASTTTSG